MAESGNAIYLLAFAFAITAFVYSSVGLAGGSSYTAMLAIVGTYYLAIPIISLLLNTLVSSVGTYHFVRYKHVRWRLVIPFLVTSMPMAYLGATLHLPKVVFLWALWCSLIFVALRIYAFSTPSLHLSLTKTQRLIVAFVSGALLGLIAGIVGIGGGIYLVPLIIVLGLGNAKEAAACGVVFIFLNSLLGLLGRLQHQPVDIRPYWPLLIAVIIGGFAGSYLGASRFQPRTVEQVLGVVILTAIVLLGKQLLLD